MGFEKLNDLFYVQNIAIILIFFYLSRLRDSFGG